MIINHVSRLNIRTHPIRFLFLSTSLIGCTSTQLSSFNHAERSQRHYGHAILGHEVRAFRPCGQTEDLWLEDLSRQLAALYEELVPQQPAYQPMFAVFDGTTASVTPDVGFGADYQGKVSVHSIRYAGFEGPGCAWDWEGFTYRASGNEPFWSLTLKAGQGAELNRLGHESITWSRMKATANPDGIQYRLGDMSSPDASFTVYDQSCRDSMSGAYTALSGVLMLGKDSYRGCVIEGATTVVD